MRPTPRVHRDSSSIRTTAKIHKLERVGGRATWGIAPHLWTPTASPVGSEVTNGSGITHQPVSSLECSKKALVNGKTLIYSLKVILIACLVCFVTINHMLQNTLFDSQFLLYLSYYSSKTHSLCWRVLMSNRFWAWGLYSINLISLNCIIFCKVPIWLCCGSWFIDFKLKL